VGRASAFQPVSQVAQVVSRFTGTTLLRSSSVTSIRPLELISAFLTL
jgi:hypothetical protein